MNQNQLFKHIDNAVELIINTRDFCGNEMEAIQDYCADEGIKGWHDLYKVAVFHANNRWNNYKKAAGVNAKHIF